jgi:hypothetical protein
MPFLTRSSCIFERLVISFRGRRTLSGDEVADWLDQFPPVSALKITECSGLGSRHGHRLSRIAVSASSHGYIHLT